MTTLYRIDPTANMARFYAVRSTNLVRRMDIDPGMGSDRSQAAIFAEYLRNDGRCF